MPKKINPVKHEISSFDSCHLFNSSYRHSDGYSRAICTCGWISAPARQNSAAIVAMHTAHAERELKQV